MYVGIGAIVGSVADLSLVNGGVLAAGIGLLTFGAFGVYSGRKMSVDERAALLHLNKRLGSRLGMHGQQVWRGVGSRPTWRVLAYSGEVPPRRRALVLLTP